MKGRQTGFTLIELLVVLVVVGVLLSAATLSLRSSDSAIERKQANQIQALFNAAQDQATWQQKTFLVIPDEKGLSVNKWVAGEWQESSSVHALLWDERLKLTWSLPPLIQNNNLPISGWLVMPNGEVQPGEIFWQLRSKTESNTVLRWDQWLSFSLQSE